MPFNRWLDLRGNHDAFNLKGDDDPQNFFRNYSVQGYVKGNAAWYLLTVAKGFKIEC